jgi:hypothetical protein
MKSVSYAYETGSFIAQILLWYLTALFVVELARRAYLKYTKYRLVKMPKEERVKKPTPIMYVIALAICIIVKLLVS